MGVCAEIGVIVITRARIRLLAGFGWGSGCLCFTRILVYFESSFDRLCLC